MSSPSLIRESIENSLAWLISCGLISVLTHLSCLFSRSFMSSCWFIRCFSYLLKYFAQTSLILLSLSLYFSYNVSLWAWAWEVILLTNDLNSSVSCSRWLLNETSIVLILFVSSFLSCNCFCSTLSTYASFVLDKSFIILCTSSRLSLMSFSRYSLFLSALALTWLIFSLLFCIILFDSSIFSRLTLICSRCWARVVLCSLS